jgi:hypothetical protein
VTWANLLERQRSPPASSMGVHADGSFVSKDIRDDRYFSVLRDIDVGRL